MSTKAKIIIVVVLVTVAALVYYFLFKPKDESEVIDANGNIKPQTPGAVVTVANDNFPLVQGMQGDNVRRLQMALNYIKPSNPLIVDGSWGSQTSGKLYTSVSTTLSQTPLSETNFNQIIALGNRAKGA